MESSHFCHFFDEYSISTPISFLDLIVHHLSGAQLICHHLSRDYVICVCHLGRLRTSRSPISSAKFPSIRVALFDMVSEREGPSG